MQTKNVDARDNTLARAAGALYLVIIVAGIYSEMAVRRVIIDPADAAVTAVNLLASEGLFKSAFAADSVMLICDVAVAVLLYALFKRVNATAAMAAMTFRLMQAAILGMNLLHYYGALLLKQAGALKADETDMLALFMLQLHSYGYDLGLIFFGVGTIVLGVLVIRCDFLPSALGYGLLAAAAVYLLGSALRFLWPQGADFIEPLYIIPFLAEFSFSLWLLIQGASVQSEAS